MLNVSPLHYSSVRNGDHIHPMCGMHWLHPRNIQVSRDCTQHQGTIVLVQTFTYVSTLSVITGSTTHQSACASKREPVIPSRTYLKTTR